MVDLPTSYVQDSSPRRAVVLSGGGALGAYEAGVMKFVLDDLALESEAAHRPRFDIFTGTSVGALNCSFLAGSAEQPDAGIGELLDYWENIRFDDVLRFGAREVATLVWLILGRGTGLRLAAHRRERPAAAGHPPVAGFFDTTRVMDDLSERIPWTGLRENLTSGAVQGVALCATEVCTGMSVVFYQTAPGVNFRPGRDPAKITRPVALGIEHAMASAAIPFLFPAVQVDGVCHTDGGLRQNTPLNPALRLGADRVLVVSLTPKPSVAARQARLGCRRNPYPGMFFMLGRTVRAMLESSIDYELNRIEMYNQLITGGRERFGDEFLEHLDASLGNLRNAAYRPILTAHIRPSRDPEELAIEALESAPEELEMQGVPGDVVSRLVASSSFMESNLLSYLMFTKTFARSLCELGYEDAKREGDSIRRLFEE